MHSKDSVTKIQENIPLSSRAVDVENESRAEVASMSYQKRETTSLLNETESLNCTSNDSGESDVSICIGGRPRRPSLLEIHNTLTSAKTFIVNDSNFGNKYLVGSQKDDDFIDDIPNPIQSYPIPSLIEKEINRN